MDARANQPQQPASTANQRLQAEVRLFARLEAATILLQSFVDVGRVALNEKQSQLATAAATPAKPATPEKPRNPWIGIDEDMADAWEYDEALAQEEAEEAGQAAPSKPAPPRNRPYRPGVHATPLIVLAHRAATKILEAAQLCHTVANRLLDQGVDLDAAVYKRRISDYVLEFLSDCGVDITQLNKHEAQALQYALDRVDEVIHEAVQWLGMTPRPVIALGPDAERGEDARAP